LAILIIEHVVFIFFFKAYGIFSYLVSDNLNYSGGIFLYKGLQIWIPKKKLHVKSHCILTLFCLPFSNFFSSIMQFNFYCINESIFRLIKALSLECQDHAFSIFGTLIHIFFHFSVIRRAPHEFKIACLEVWFLFSHLTWFKYFRHGHCYV
jgi:hypothetical protein